MAVPLLHGEDALGVLEVLDRPADARFRVEEVDLLGLFGIQAAAALALLRRARTGRGGARGTGRRPDRAGPDRRPRWRRSATTGRSTDFLAALDALLARAEPR